MTPTLLIIPGLGDSGPEHWQTYWATHFKNSARVVQDNWETPQLKDWLVKLDEAIRAQEGHVILVAHSLAVSLVAHWAQIHSSSNVTGALLVSTSDVDTPEYTPDSVRNFAPMPLARLPFPSVVVASEDDDFVSPSRAAYFAKQWGSDFVNIGHKGHINAASNLGDWKEGQEILMNLVRSL